jgi:hypothetical protein
VCRIARVFGDTLCPNYLVSTRALRLGDPNLYSAHELVQMVPLHGRHIALRLWEENEWYGTLLPNAGPVSLDAVTDRSLPGLSTAKRLGETLLRLPPGNLLECWERERKITKLSAQAGENSAEVLYSVDVCKGHDRGHGRRVMKHMLGHGRQESREERAQIAR